MIESIDYTLVMKDTITLILEEHSVAITNMTCVIEKALDTGVLHLGSDDDTETSWFLMQHIHPFLQYQLLE